MKNHIKENEWIILEEEFIPKNNRISESLFSIGNGKIGQRANFEEDYSGDSLQGSYVAGVYYPDKTKVGWWKNGYPEYFAKVPNATNWIGLHLKINDVRLDLAKCEVEMFRRELNMKEGFLKRDFRVKTQNGHRLEVSTTRFCSLAETSLSTLQYSIKALSGPLHLEVESYLDGNIKNEDANYGESFWDGISQSSHLDVCSVLIKTLKTNYVVGTFCKTEVEQNGHKIQAVFTNKEDHKFASVAFHVQLEKDEDLSVYKYVNTLSSLDFNENDMLKIGTNRCAQAAQKGFEQLKTEHAEFWLQHWIMADITIDGDVKGQQAIRYNIFQLFQTYTGEDSRLNIGPKGFTGEKYGGSTYWDTEAYCLPFYQSTSEAHVAKNLLLYRYQHLNKAIENAQKLGFTKGAALYPMVTMNGEECHNEWEITFEEIHRNGAISYAIYDYVNYTGDEDYIHQYGLEVLIGISRFWAQRVNWSEAKSAYVMLGVTGPNEFENNVNNNWYTNKLAAWNLKYCLECIDKVKLKQSLEWQRIQKLTAFEDAEIKKWQHIIDNMYFPYDGARKIYLQNDGFLDKEQLSVADLKPEERPIVEHWSWDRILRSVFIKQADVLQGLYFFEDEFDTESIRRHYDFYEPKTVHESSLSPCVHAILAAKIGDYKRAYEFYLRTARLDLDNYNNDTDDGLHITSMAGTWLSMVKGFAGMRVHDDEIHFTPFLPENWNGFSFKIMFRGSLLKVRVAKTETKVEILNGKQVKIKIHEDKKRVAV